MATSIRILLIEDSDDDVSIVLHALRRAGYDPSTTRVDNREAYLGALASGSFEAIISDYSMPQFSCRAALSLMKTHGLDLPFIVVSGTTDEDSAVGILKAGAHDFVTKQNLARLGPALDRELVEATNRAERRAAERSLSDQRDFLRLVLDTNPGLVFAKDPDGRFTLANRAMAALYGATIDELLGKSDDDLNRPPDEAARSRAAELEVIRNRGTVLIGAESLTDAGTGATRWFEMRKVPLTVSASAQSQVLSIATEVTDRKAAEAALRETEEQFRQAQKMEAVGQLAGGVAHDFNNLLTAILGYTELLLVVTKDRPDLSADLEEIKKAGERAGHLTRQLLTFSRKQVVQPAHLNLNDVVSELEKMLRRVIGDDVTLEAIKAPSLRHLRADPNQIEQILMNLAVNAKDAMPRGGVLTIETRNETMPVDPQQPLGATQPCVSLIVADNGRGIPPEIQARVFEPFFTTKGPGKGTGLGLSTVYGIVTQNGGVIAVESERNRGTRFVIRFPAVDLAADVEAPAPQPVAARSGTETILLVEDEPGVRHLVQRVLAGRGYDVLEACDVGDAAAIAATHDGPIHLLLSDVVMPGLSGPDLAQRIVAERPDVRVLYMSGFASRLTTDLGSLSAGVSILHKPFTPESLVRTVRDCLDVAAR